MLTLCYSMVTSLSDVVLTRKEGKRRGVGKFTSGF